MPAPPDDSPGAGSPAPVPVDPPPERDSLSVLVTVDGDDDRRTMGIFRRGDGDVAVVGVPLEVLRRNLRSTVERLRQVVDDIADAGGRLPLREIQVKFEITAGGGINLVGTSELKGTGGITFVFRE